MARAFWTLLAGATLLGHPGLAGDRALADRLAAEIAGHIEPGWSVRASWREATLVAFVTPPYAESWAFINEQARQREMWAAICATIGEGTWAALPEGGGIAVEPVFGGKSETRLRQACAPGGLADAS
ncbi:hypothetical protein BH23PSE1_BH23PSE1_17780 [soil metagenome]